MSLSTHHIRLNYVASITFKRLKKKVITPETNIMLLCQLYLKKKGKKSRKSVVRPTPLPLNVPEENLSPMKFCHCRYSDSFSDCGLPKDRLEQPPPLQQNENIPTS